MNGIKPTAAYTPAQITIVIDHDEPVTFTTIEDAALALLEISNPVFLGRLKVDHVGRLQRIALGIIKPDDAGAIGTKTVNDV